MPAYKCECPKHDCKTTIFYTRQPMQQAICDKCEKNCTKVR